MENITLLCEWCDKSVTVNVNATLKNDGERIVLKNGWGVDDEQFNGAACPKCEESAKQAMRGVK